MLDLAIPESIESRLDAITIKDLRDENAQLKREVEKWKAGMDVRPIAPFPPNSNPFCHDYFNMGHEVGTNVTVMFARFPKDRHDFLIVVDTETGQRVRINLGEPKEGK